MHKGMIAEYQILRIEHVRATANLPHTIRDPRESFLESLEDSARLLCLTQFKHPYIFVGLCKDYSIRVQVSHEEDAATLLENSFAVKVE
jgi:hypothetical protein